MNGKHGDDPLLDIIEHKIEVFGKEGDEVIKKISRYISWDRLHEWFDKNDLKNLKEDDVLKIGKEKLKELKNEAKERGCEVDE